MEKLHAMPFDDSAPQRAERRSGHAWCHYPISTKGARCSGLAPFNGSTLAAASSKSTSGNADSCRTVPTEPRRRERRPGFEHASHRTVALSNGWSIQGTYFLLRQG